jgi:hypothetical protein
MKRQGKDIKVQVEMSPDTSKRFTEACLKVIRKREQREESRKATA